MKQMLGIRLEQFRKEQAAFRRCADPFHLDAETVPAGFQLEIIELWGSAGMRRAQRHNASRMSSVSVPHDGSMFSTSLKTPACYMSQPGNYNMFLIGMKSVSITESNRRTKTLGIAESLL